MFITINMNSILIPDYLGFIREPLAAKLEDRDFWTGERLDPNTEDGNWIDYGNFWINVADQGSSKWLDARYLRLTGCNVGGAVNHSNFSTPYDILLDITGIKPKIFDCRQKAVMKHGSDTEPIARDWYSDKIGLQVEELGLAVPKWELRLGASLDGSVLSPVDNKTPIGNLEIKCPQRMYRPLLRHQQDLLDGVQFEKYYHKHIWDSHYDQMQLGMVITGQTWSDYLVYSTNDKMIFTDRVYFNQDYWENDLKPAIYDFLDNKLDPILKLIENLKVKISKTCLSL